MSSPTESGYAFVVLLRDGDDATGLARLLEDVRLPDATVPSVFVAPPVRGLDFFADESGQAELDQWWAANVAGDALPIYLLNHEDSLSEWLGGLDGTFYVGIPNPALADQYPKNPQVRTFMSGGPLDFATIIMRDFSGADQQAAVIFDQGEALRMAALSSDFPIDLDDTAFDFGDPEPAASPNPFDTPPGPFSGQPPATPPNPFATPTPAAPAASPFGGQPASPFGGQPAASPFGGQPAASPFGGQPATPTSSPFGGEPSAPAASPFGNPPAASPFGGQPGSPFDAPASSPFGPAPQTNAPLSSGPAFPTAPPGFGAPAGNPFDQLSGQPAAPIGGFGPGSGPVAPQVSRKKAPEPATAHPFDLMSGGRGDSGGGGPAPAPYQPSTPAPDASPWPASGASSGGGDASPFAPAPGPGAGSFTPDPLLKPNTRPEAGFSADPRSQPMSNGGGKANKIPKMPKMPAFSAFAKGRSRSNFNETPNRDLANLIVDRGPTIVVMGSRKGGVGKTSYAAGIAIVAGGILDAVGHKAAIVDANIANPDAWGQMNLREGAATVREVVAALTANREPPPPVHSTTPALAVYPESRETTEYSKTDIKRFADYLRRRYTFIVVDMSNRLPDPMAGPEAAAAAYWLEHSDVLVLPTTSSKQDFNGVLDYLDVRGLPPTVVPYIIPSVKKNREHPVTQQYLTVIKDRVHRIVEIPDEADKVRYAGMEGVPVEQVSPALRVAYRELTEVIVRVPPRARM